MTFELVSVCSSVLSTIILSSLLCTISSKLSSILAFLAVGALPLLVSLFPHSAAFERFTSSNSCSQSVFVLSLDALFTVTVGISAV